MSAAPTANKGGGTLQIPAAGMRRRRGVATPVPPIEQPNELDYPNLFLTGTPRPFKNSSASINDLTTPTSNPKLDNCWCIFFWVSVNLPVSLFISINATRGDGHLAPTSSHLSAIQNISKSGIPANLPSDLRRTLQETEPSFSFGRDTIMQSYFARTNLTIACCISVSE